VTNPERLKKYEAYFQKPVEGGKDSNALVYEKSAAKLPNITKESDPNMDFFLSRLLEDAQASQKAITPFEKKLMELLQSELQNGTPALEEIAPKMGMSARTLQRRLGDLGYTFSQALQQHRLQLAATYLKEPHLNISDAALMVGYSSLTSFSAAFHKFHGVTPSKYKQSLN